MAPGLIPAVWRALPALRFAALHAGSHLPLPA